MIRSVSLVDRLVLEFSGNHFAHALAIGDVDSDGLNELVIGNVDGVLAIFKGEKTNKPWKKCSELGTVVCVGVGDLLNIGKNVLVCINAEGQCYIFNISCEGDGTTLSTTPSPSVSTSGSVEQPKPSPNLRTMKAIHKQILPTPNVKVMHIASIAPDGQNELFVGLTDRSFVVYRWSEEKRTLEVKKSFKLPGQIGSLSVTVSRDGTHQVLVSQPGGTYAPFSYLSPAPCTPTTTAATNLSPRSHTSDEDATTDGKELPRSGSTSSSTTGGGATTPTPTTTATPTATPIVAATASGGAGSHRLGSISSMSSSFSLPGSPLDAVGRRRESDATPTLTMCEVIGQPQRSSPTSSTEIVGQIVDQSESSLQDGRRSNTVAVCTLDGGIRLFKDEEKQWELQVDHSLFAVEKLDFTGNGSDEIVVCSWDGMTYIVDQQRNTVRFQFEQNVSAFTAGYYGNSNGANRPCLVFSTFSNRIFVYHDISLPSVASSNLIATIQSKMDHLPRELAGKLNSLSDDEKQRLFHQCLYEWDGFSHNSP